MRRIVDLPQPEGPRSATTSSDPIASETEARMRRGAPRGWGNSMLTSTSSQMGASAMGRSGSAREGEALLAERVEAAPDEAVEGDDDERHHGHRGREDAEAPPPGRVADDRAEPARREDRAAARHVLRDDAGVP